MFWGTFCWFKEKEMTLPIAIAFTAIGVVQPSAFHFQSETVSYQDMNKGVMVAELMQLSAIGGEKIHVVVRF